MTLDPPMAAKILDRAADLVDQGWCRFTQAKDVSGRLAVRPTAPEAAQWCLIGAIIMAEHELTGEPPEAIERGILGRAPWNRILARHHDARWNIEPERTADEVAAFLRTEAEKLRS